MNWFMNSSLMIIAIGRKKKTVKLICPIITLQDSWQKIARQTMLDQIKKGKDNERRRFFIDGKTDPSLKDKAKL